MKSLTKTKTSISLLNHAVSSPSLFYQDQVCKIATTTVASLNATTNLKRKKSVADLALEELCQSLSSKDALIEELKTELEILKKTFSEINNEQRQTIDEQSRNQRRSSMTPSSQGNRRKTLSSLALDEVQQQSLENTTRRGSSRIGEWIARGKCLFSSLSQRSFSKEMSTIQIIIPYHDLLRGQLVTINSIALDSNRLELYLSEKDCLNYLGVSKEWIKTGKVLDLESRKERAGLGARQFIYSLYNEIKSDFMELKSPIMSEIVINGVDYKDDKARGI